MTPAPTSTPTPSATPDAIAAKWHPVPPQDSVSGAQFVDVVWTGSRFVAVGIAVDGGGTFLDSDDGSTWHRQANLGEQASPMRLAAGPGGVVAVGSVGERLASWVSADGLTWSAHPGAFPTPDVGMDTVAVTDVVPRGDGWLAIGRRDPFCNFECGFDPIRAYVWTSSDGAHWTRVLGQADLGEGGMDAVTQTADGFVAVGNSHGHAAIWTSPDGLVWSRVPDDPMFGSNTVDGLPVRATAVASRDGVVVVLGVRSGGEASRVRAWWSADGGAWSKASVEKAAGGQVFSVAPARTGFLATGPSGGDSCRGGIWASTDGRAWRCDAADPSFEGFGPYAAAASGSADVAVGLTSAGVDEESPEGLPGAVWVRSP
jgi:hypothetical protein